MIAPPALYIIPLKELLRGDFKIAAQNCYIKTSGAFTGEIRCVQLPRASWPPPIQNPSSPPAPPSLSTPGFRTSSSVSASRCRPLNLRALSAYLFLRHRPL